jgi:hypothetical protein
VLSLILAYRHINRQKYALSKDPWLASAMEKGISIQGSHPASACDILRPLSQTSACPTSGALAAMALDKSEFPADGVGSPALRENEKSVQRYDTDVQQMCDEDSEGMRTWKRLVVEYR